MFPKRKFRTLPRSEDQWDLELLTSGLFQEALQEGVGVPGFGLDSRSREMLSWGAWDICLGDLSPVSCHFGGIVTLIIPLLTVVESLPSLDSPFSPMNGF